MPNPFSAPPRSRRSPDLFTQLFVALGNRPPGQQGATLEGLVGEFAAERFRRRQRIAALHEGLLQQLPKAQGRTEVESLFRRLNQLGQLAANEHAAPFSRLGTGRRPFVTRPGNSRFSPLANERAF